MKELLIFCDGGLANRVRCLVSGMALAELLGLQYLVLWPSNNRCGAPFHSVFLPGCIALPVRLQDLTPYEGGLHTWVHENDCGFTGPITLLRGMSGIEEVKALLKGEEKPIVFSENSFLPWLPDSLIDKCLNQLSFRPEIIAKTCNVLNDGAKGPYYGIHLRTTDFTVPAPVEQMLGVVAGNPGARFFVCSDDPAVEVRFSAFPNVFLHQKDAYVEKMTDGPWRGQVLDSDGLPYTSNINRSEQSVVDACVDMLLLAVSTPIETSPSSFLALSARLRSCGLVQRQLFGIGAGGDGENGSAAPHEGAATTGSSAEGGGGALKTRRVHLVNYEAGLGIKDGILTKYALKMQDGLETLGVEVTVDHRPDPAADVNHHINYLAYKPVPDTKNTLMVTHFTQGTESKLAFLRQCMETADAGIAMSPAMSEYLTSQGIGAQTYVLPAHDGFARKRKVVAIVTKTYPDGRKREWMFPELLKGLDKELFAFQIMGHGWGPIVEALSVDPALRLEYTENFDMEKYLEILNSSDYLLYTGDEDCLAQSLIDAAQIGIKTIAKAQPDLPVDYPFDTQEELNAIFQKLSYNPVADWTWLNYCKRHLAVWEAL